MKNILVKILKGLAVGVPAVILVAIVINAADNKGVIKDSLVGRLITQNEDGCGGGMVFIETETGGFCFDMYEVSPGKGCPNKNISRQGDTRNNLDEPGCVPVSSPGAIPWRYVSQSQAISLCAKAGKRLPTSNEWYLASLGTPDPASGWGADDCHVNNNRDNQPGLTGAGKKCVSSAGAYDMIGNVWEWVKAEARDGEYEGRSLPKSGFIKAADIQGLPAETDRNNPDPNYNEDYVWINSSGTRGMARGGYWDNKSEAGLYSVYLDTPPSFAGTGVGFRCAK